MSIARHETPAGTAVGAFDAADQKLVRYLGLNPDNPADRAMVAVCRHYGFDPILKHVIVLPKGGVYVTRDGLLHVAHQSGQLDGIVVDDGPTLVDNEWVTKVSVYRKDMTHPFTFVGRYPVNGGNKQYAPEMSLKAAESHALRRAFAITGLPTVDEQRPDTPPQRSGLAAALAPDPSPVAETLAETTVAVGGAGSIPASDPATGEVYDVSEAELIEDVTP